MNVGAKHTFCSPRPSPSSPVTADARGQSHPKSEGSQAAVFFEDPVREPVLYSAAPHVMEFPNQAHTPVLH